MPNSTLCTWCQPADEFAALSRASRAQRLRALREMPYARREAILTRLDTLGPVGRKFREDLGENMPPDVVPVKKEQETQSPEAHAPASSVLGRVGENCLPPPSLPQEHMDQGQFGLCTAYACATAVAGALAAKYLECVEPNGLLQIWWEKHVPSTPQWPYDFLSFMGTIRIKTGTSFMDISCKTRDLVDFRTTKTIIEGIAGLRCVVIVVKTEGGNTHSVVAVRVRGDGFILCLNSWGPDKKPYLVVNPGNFQFAFFD